MLDLRVSRARTTQGQSPAQMTLITPSSPVDESAELMGETLEVQPAPPAIDPRAVADRVYALLQAELRQLRARAGSRRR